MESKILTGGLFPRQPGGPALISRSRSAFQTAAALALSLLALLAAPALFAAPTEKAIFAGGCFWCEEPAFERRSGVVSVDLGLHRAGRRRTRPTSRCPPGRPATRSRWRSSIDPARSTYEKLLEVFWHNIDPLARRTGSSATTATSTGPRSSTSTTRRRRRPRSRSASSRRNRSFEGKIVDGDRRRRRRSTPPRSTTRTSTRRTPCGTAPTGWAAAATSG